MCSENIKLSIIVPVYNVEQYIHPCMESIFRQGLDDSDFELILVNDGTQDNSFRVISDIIESHQNIRILEQENSGPSMARNIGIKSAKGQYLMFVDSDDLLIDNSIPKLLDIANEQSADLLVGDFLRLTDEQIAEGKYDVCQGYTIKVKTGYELYLEDLDPHECYVWRILFRREFLLERCLSFIMHRFCFEDIPFVQECYLKANKCVTVNSTVYIYRIGHVSITYAMTLAKLLDLNESFKKMWHLQSLPGLPDAVRYRLQDNNFATFSFELWCLSHNKKLLDVWKDVVDDLNQKVPDIWFDHGLKQKFVSLMYRRWPGFYFRLRYILKISDQYNLKL
jgi:glycosyltransferase involved in cell wall biosynthesis